MGLIDNAVNKRSGGRTAIISSEEERQIRDKVKADPNVNKIRRTSRFVEIAEKVLALNLVTEAELEECQGARTRVRLSHWPLGNLQATAGNPHTGVTEKGWAGIVASALGGLGGQRSQIQLAQRNGRWKIMEFEVRDVNDPSLNGGDDVLVIACKWIDTANQNDIVYKMGRPAMDQVMGGGMSKEDMVFMLQAVMAGATAEMKAALEPLLEQVRGKEEELPPAITEKKPTKKRRPGRKPRS